MKALLPPVVAGVVLVMGSLVSMARADIGYQFVTVGNPGNSNDTTGYGEVDYAYEIGTYDVTLNQYATFLNAVAQTDTYSLYNTSLATDLNVAGISQSGSSGSYSYSVIGDGQHPVTYVSWFDAVRMANWMQNGQPTGLGEVTSSTEEGAYTLDGANSGVSISKNANALYWIPSENEWYKAAYYDPNKGGLGVGGYWTYATKSDTAPGNVVGSGVNQANYNNGVYSVTQSGSYSGAQNYLTDVGVFGSNSASAYGTYDQTGDVYDWNDAVIDSSRTVRGGAWNSALGGVPSSYRDPRDPTNEGDNVGFRLATVPEPTVIMNILVACGLLLAKRKRTR